MEGFIVGVMRVLMWVFVIGAPILAACRTGVLR